MFQAKSFNPVSFSIHSFKMAQQDSARSGYWRLFYYNMQEEALKADEQVKGKTEAKGKSESSAQKPVVTRPARKPKPVPVQDRETVEEIPVRPKPIFRKPSIISQPFNLEFLAVVSLQFQQMLLQSEPYRLAMLMRKAANDEDEDDIELLLLAA